MAARRTLDGRTILVGLPGADLDPGSARRLRRLGAAGAILFRRNLDDPAAARRLLRGVAAELPGPPLLAVDQEGGRVSRLEGWIGPTPTAARLAAAGPGAIRAFGAATAGVVRAVGFNLDFAPVVDLSPPDAANGIGDRAFGTDPRLVAELAGAFLDGLQDGGVAGCIKHFPGLGSTRVDSHRTLPVVARPTDALRAAELVPFRLLGGRAASVMVGHGHYTALDPGEPRPASCSTAVVGGLLRGELSYRGLAVSDDMEMGAVAPRDEGGAAAVEALAAGCDLLLYCADLDRAESAAAALAARAAADPQFAARLDEAAGRVAAFGRRWPAPTAEDDLVVARDALRAAADGVAPA